MSVLVGQLSFQRHEISSSLDWGGTSVYAIDIDSDGDIDILTTDQENDKISWYENDGSENFTEHAINNYDTDGYNTGEEGDADGANGVYAIDIDGDGDTDVLSTSYNDGKVAWYENDGSENFSQNVITTSSNYASDIIAIDIDGDGDIDVLSASGYDAKVAWYENDGSQNFTEHTITSSATGANIVHALDLDRDGDIDVVSRDGNTSVWFENNGSGSFTEHQLPAISGSNNVCYAVFPIDLDNDGDIDIIC